MLLEQPPPKANQDFKKYIQRYSGSKIRFKSNRQIVEILWKLRHPTDQFINKSPSFKGDLLFYKTRTGRIGTATVYNKVAHQKTTLIFPNLGYNQNWYLNWKTNICQKLMSMNHCLVFLEIPQTISCSTALLEEDLCAVYRALTEANISPPTVLMGSGYGSLLACNWLSMGASADFLLIFDVPKHPKDLIEKHDIPKYLKLNPVEEILFYFNVSERQRRTLRYKGWSNLSDAYIKNFSNLLQSNRFDINISNLTLDDHTVCISNQKIPINARKKHVIKAVQPHILNNQNFTSKVQSLIQTDSINWVNQ